jgi:phage host-nuclease inhibitor protein Gam
MKKTRIKPVSIATQIEFEAAVGELAKLELHKRTINDAREVELQRINTHYDSLASPVAERMKAVGALVVAYAEAHRAELLPKEAKSVKLTLATYGWRTGNRTVALMYKVTVENAINALKAGGLGDAYVATKEEIAQSKILADCKDDKTLPYLRMLDGVMQPVLLSAVGPEDRAVGDLLRRTRERDRCRGNAPTGGSGVKATSRSVSEQFKQDLEDCAVSIQRCRAIGQAMAENTAALRLLLQEFDERLVSIHEKLPANRAITTEFGRLRMRIQRLNELRNVQELESFQIQIGRAMEEAWRQLP